LKDNNVQVFALGLIEALADESGPITQVSVKKMAKENLETLTKETDGKVLFVDKKVTIESATAELIKAINN
jgi:hypothetical protein